MHYPFAENELIVQQIGHDLLRAILAAPVLMLSIWFGYRAIDAGRFRAARNWLIHGIGAIVWAGSFLLHWVVPSQVTIDVPSLRFRMDEEELLAKRRIGYFDCTIRLDARTSVPWSARKLTTWQEPDGQRYLWIEGNADEPANVEQSLRDVAKTLGVAPISADRITQQIAVTRDNTKPMFIQRTARPDAFVLIYHEPNDYVTPCLMVRY